MRTGRTGWLAATFAIVFAASALTCTYADLFSYVAKPDNSYTWQLKGVEEAFKELWYRASGRESLLQTQSRIAFPDKCTRSTVQTASPNTKPRPNTWLRIIG